MADTFKDFLEMVVRLGKNLPKLPHELFYPPAYVEQAAEMYKDRDWFINGYDGSRYYHGELLTAPYKSLDVTRLNEKIASMELPDYLRQLPKRNYDVYLRGEWDHAKKGDNHEQINQT